VDFASAISFESGRSHAARSGAFTTVLSPYTWAPSLRIVNTFPALALGPMFL